MLREVQAILPGGPQNFFRTASPRPVMQSGRLNLHVGQASFRQRGRQRTAADVSITQEDNLPRTRILEPLKHGAMLPCPAPLCPPASGPAQKRAKLARERGGQRPARYAQVMPVKVV